MKNEMTTKILSTRSIASLSLICSLALSTIVLAEGAFIKTAHTLNNETRGYCLDVFGHTPNIRTDAPIRMHSCKYGENADDQIFEWLGTGQIGLPVLGGCLEPDKFDVGGELYIRDCTDNKNQLWTIGSQGEISPQTRSDLCVTVTSDYHLAGAPPWISPGYYARESNLQLCDESAQIYQQFRWGEVEGQERSWADTVGREMPMAVAEQIRELVKQGAGPRETAALYAGQPRVYESGEVEVVENLAYGPHERHRLDVHTDNQRYGDDLMPVVMFFHGGGFIRGNKAGNRNVADYFASLGLVGVNATYRLAPEVKWPAGSEDIGAAVAWVKKNIAEYGGDPDQVFVIGVSAAAYHVATYAFRPDVLGTSVPVANGIVLVSGVYGTDNSNPDEGRLAYFGEDLSRWPQISNLGNIERTDIPLLVAVSDYDTPKTKTSFADLVHELTVEHNKMPRVVQLLGHNHYSSTLSIGTQDTQLSAEVLQLIRSTAGDNQ
jgi:acetyl esterase/lipase